MIQAIGRLKNPDSTYDDIIIFFDNIMIRTFSPDYSFTMYNRSYEWKDKNWDFVFTRELK